MIDTFQKIFLAGIGATATTAEAVKKTLDEMVEKGRITRDEAKEMADKMMDQGKREFEDAKGEAHDFFKSMMNRFARRTDVDLFAFNIHLTFFIFFNAKNQMGGFGTSRTQQPG
jgi:polyhydroxyalkanoate synthesis regulator phasin